MPPALPVAPAPPFQYLAGIIHWMSKPPICWNDPNVFPSRKGSSVFFLECIYFFGGDFKKMTWDMESFWKQAACVFHILPCESPTALRSTLRTGALPKSMPPMPPPPKRSQLSQEKGGKLEMTQTLSRGRFYFRLEGSRGCRTWSSVRRGEWLLELEVDGWFFLVPTRLEGFIAKFSSRRSGWQSCEIAWMKLELAI